MDHLGAIEPASASSPASGLEPAAIPATAKPRAGAPLGVALALLTFLVYSRVVTCGFVNFDDRQYVAENELVQRGLTLEGIKWAFTTGELANWHPLTWLSYMVDCQVFGLRPGWMHLENVALHIIDTLLLLGLLVRMTGAVWRSAMVAALFALHPLHVESVAWISERKDVLSTLFWFLATGAYLNYVAAPSRGRMAIVALWLALGLMAKPMLVTLPCTLLLLDYWPLQRFRTANATKNFWSRLLSLAWEKWPLFLVVVASSVVTFLVQRGAGAMQDLEFLPWRYRLANVPVSYVRYLGKTVWPVDLAAFYPLPQMSEQAAILSGSFFDWALAATVLLAIASYLAFRARQQAPYLLVGWLWYLGTLVPVIGLVQVGEQAMADRYSYVPLIGIFIILAWGAAELAARLRVSPQWLTTGAALLLAGCAVMSWKQIGYWRNTETLFDRAIAVTPRNSRAHNILGVYLANIGRPDEGKQHLRRALEIAPGYYPSLNNLGEIFATEGNDAEAARHYRQALHLHPDSIIAHGNLGNVYVRNGQLDEAVTQYVDVLRIITANRYLDYRIGLQARAKLEFLLPTTGTIDDAVKRFTSPFPRFSAEQLTRIRSFYTAVLARDLRFDAARQAIARFDAAKR